MMDKPTVQLMVRRQCHLCENARRVVAAVCEPAGTAWEEVDVDTSEDLQRRYGELVPVVLVDGVQVDYLRIDPGRLRAALSPPTGRRGLRGILRRSRSR